MTASNPQLGATVIEGRVQFRVWAPDAHEIVVRLGQEEAALLLMAEGGGYYSGVSTMAAVGSLYRYQLNGTHCYPDPYSRYQPEGPHGPSQIIDPRSYCWQDGGWKGLDPERQIIYEMHVGTFTSQGTYAAAAEQLPTLAELGVTSVEIMPVAEFVGRFGWGYDGVNLFAPYHPYGTPDDLRAFVDCAHALGLGVILDVVYNHFGADGNYLSHFARDYFTDSHKNPWGATINYSAAPVRRLAIENAAYWIREFHFDGLRLDATQNIHDPEHPALFKELVETARAAAPHRHIVISGEDYLQRTPLLGRATWNAGLDQLWNDDFHHTARVALTGDHSGYFGSYRGHAQELVSALKNGYLFQGQYDGCYQKPRGSPVGLEPRSAFIAFTQNHDQIANTLYGARLHTLTSPGKYRAMTAVLLLGPQTPLLFMGQEFNASSPFAYFADYSGDVAAQLWANRRKELEPFDLFRETGAQAAVFNPCSADTVRASTLDLTERETHRETYQLYRDLIALRRQDLVLVRRPQVPWDGAVLDEHAFVMRLRDAEHGDRLLLVNLGAQVDTRAWAEPLLAPPINRQWRVRWSSNDVRYGGLGWVAPPQPLGWHLPAEGAFWLAAD